METTQKNLPIRKDAPRESMQKRKRLDYFYFQFPFTSHFKKRNVTVQKTQRRKEDEKPRQVLHQEQKSEAESYSESKYPKMVHGNVSKNGKGVKRAPAKESKPKKDQGHDFRCVPKSIAVIFEQCLDKNPEKRALVDELGFGKVLKEIYNHFDTYDHTIHAVVGEVEITTQKIGKALGLSSTGTPYDDKVTPKDLSEEDHNVYKFFEGKTQAALSRMIFNTQKCFLLPTSTPNVTPRALPTLFDLENTRNRNWALHVHNFLLEEVEKAKTNHTKSVSGYCYAMLIIYFHETHFENSRDSLASVDSILEGGHPLEENKAGENKCSSK
ncbi:hypothetical protein PIB30_074719 [Stylosanthes scabra]|uniref:Uncharacterized protein n=1 Tax=Stylosanthes scabra TaxID=79078 RepID=A0ABU6TQK9_9FABA|nr:hypothetical protein [Stylosanthes scabra]